MTLVDAAVAPDAYDAHLSGSAASKVVQLDAREAARRCLDETPLFRSVGVEQLCALAGTGLESLAAAEYSFRVALALRERDRLADSEMQKLFPNLYRAGEFASREVNGSRESKRLDDARDRIVLFSKNGALDGARAAELARTLMERRTPQDPLRAIEDGVTVSDVLSKEPRRVLVREIVRRLSALSEQAQGVGEKISHLSRAAKLDPSDGDIARRLKMQERARLIRNLKILGVLAALGVVTWLVVHAVG